MEILVERGGDFIKKAFRLGFIKVKGSLKKKLEKLTCKLTLTNYYNIITNENLGCP